MIIVANTCDYFICKVGDFERFDAWKRKFGKIVKDAWYDILGTPDNYILVAKVGRNAKQKAVALYKAGFKKC